VRVGVRLAFQFCCEAPLEVVRREGVIQGTAGPTCRCAQLLKESVQRVQGGSPHTEPRKDVQKAGSGAQEQISRKALENIKVICGRDRYSHQLHS